MSSNLLIIQKLYDQLKPIDQVVALLEEETDASRVADFARAVEAAKDLDHRNRQRQNYWGELAIWSTKRLGQLIQDGQEAGRIAGKGRPAKNRHGAGSILREILGTETDNQARDISRRAQKVAALPEDTISAYLARQRQADEEISNAPGCSGRPGPTGRSAQSTAMTSGLACSQETVADASAAANLLWLCTIPATAARLFLDDPSKRFTPCAANATNGSSSTKGRRFRCAFRERECDAARMRTACPVHILVSPRC